MELSIISTKVEDTIAVGNKIAEIIGDNQIIVLSGGLAAGKTTLVKSICSALGSSDNVTSPTYTLANVYDTDSGNKIVHCDFYRLKTEYEVDGLGLDLYLGKAVIIVEWGERYIELFDDYLLINIEVDPEIQDQRTITINTANLNKEDQIKLDSALIKNNV